MTVTAKKPAVSKAGRKGSGKTPAKRPKAPELKHPVPAGLGPDGEALWGRIISDLDEGWELDQRELHLLSEACKTADDLAALDAAIARDGRTVEGSRGQPVVHPGIAEVRQLRALQLRLLGALELSDPVDSLKSATPEQSRKRQAAAARWAREQRRLNR